jgi:hypothetical protein
MGCERSKIEDPLNQVTSPATPEQQEACTRAQKTSELLLDFQLPLEFVATSAAKGSPKNEDSSLIRQTSKGSTSSKDSLMGPVLVNGPGSMAWFKMEKLEKRNSQSEAPSDESYKPSNSEGQQAKDFFLISTQEGESRFQLVVKPTSSSSLKHMLLHVNSGGDDTTLMYSIASPRNKSDNQPMILPLEIQAQSPGKELPQVAYLPHSGISPQGFLLKQDGKLACTVTRDGQRGSLRFIGLIEPGMDVVMYVGIICGALNAHRCWWLAV